MQLPSKDGVVCDRCHVILRDSFTYYSFDFYNMAITNNMRQPIDSVLAGDVVLSVDICSECFNKIAAVVIHNNAKVAGKTVCELDLTQLISNCKYVNIIKVDVSIAGTPFACVECGTKTWDCNAACKCGCNKFVRQASISTDNRFLEFMVCDRCYDSFVDGAQQSRVKFANMV